MNQDDINAQTELENFFSTVCNGNAVALDWLCRWHRYCHEIDDIIDDSQWHDRERMLALFVSMNDLYSHPFYVQHCQRLQPVVMLATGTFADSIKFERSKQLWQRQWAEVMRHCGNLMIDAVAFICGGYQHQRKLSAAFLAMCFCNHADKHGVVA